SCLTRLARPRPAGYVLFRRLGGFLRVGRARPVLALLLDARRLAGAPAQIVQLGAAHAAAADHLDTRDLRAVEREDALHALAVADLAHGEARVDAAVAARDANPLECLHPLARPLHHLDVDAHGVARGELRDGPFLGPRRDLLLFQFLKDVHGTPHSSSAPQRTRFSRSLFAPST